MSITDITRDRDALLAELRRAGADVSRPKKIKCPFHDDQNPSAGVYEQDGHWRFKCHGCDVSGDVFDIRARIDGKPLAEILKEHARGNGNSKPTKRIAATYPYENADGELQFEVVRFAPKGFAQRRPDGKGEFIWNLQGVTRILYQLPHLLEADPEHWVFVVEGEKDCDRLLSLGLNATCNSGGAGKWSLTDSTPLHGRRVVIIPDADDKGREHAEDVATSLHGKAAEVTIVDLPGLVPKGDSSDWFDNGGTVDALLALADAAKPWEPDADADLDDGPAPLPLRYKPFPTDALPEPIRSFIRDGAAAIGCDPAFVALPLLTAVGAAIGNTRRIRLKSDWTEPPIIWSIIVGDSGAQKTPAFDLAMKPVRDLQGVMLHRHAEAMNEYDLAKARYDVDYAAWKKCKGAGDPPAKPEPPQCSRILISDTTAEAVAPILEANQRGLLMARDEVNGWLGSFDRYTKGRGGADSAAWLSMWSGGALMIDRKTGDKKTIYVRSACTCITGGIQPGILQRAMRGENIENGMAARLLMAMPTRKPKIWTERTIEPSLHARVALLFDKLYELRANTDVETGDWEPVIVPMTFDAKAAWICWFRENAEKLNAATGALAAAYSKLEAYAARFALVIHFVRWAANDPTLANPDAIDAASIEAGATLARWFRHEAERIYAMFGESDDDRAANELMDWIERRGGSVTVRDVTHGLRAYRGKADDAHEALDGLVKAGRGRWECTAGAGRPTERFVAVTSVTVTETVENTENRVGIGDGDNGDSAVTNIDPDREGGTI